MKKNIETVIGVVLGFVLVAFVGYKMGLYPADEFREKVTSDIRDEISDLAKANEENNPGIREDGKNAYEQLKEYLNTGTENSNKDNEDSDGFERWQLVDVVDGDTIKVKKEDSSETVKVRYIGVDTPESVHSDESKNTKEGKIASEFHAELLETNGNEVYLKYDVQKEDVYGRTLAYVYIKTETGEYEMVQNILLREGMARTMTVQPNSKYADHFYEVQVEARENGKGFWGTEFFTEGE